MTPSPATISEAAAPASDEPSHIDEASLSLNRLLRRLDRLLGWIFMGVVLLNFASAAGRYLGGRPIIGADEVQVFTMVWLIFLGTILAAVRRIHLRMDVLTARMQGRRAWWRMLTEVVLTVGVCALTTWISLQFTLEIHAMEQKSDAAEVPMWIPHLSVVVGFAGMTLCALAELWSLLRRGLPSVERQPG